MMWNKEKYNKYLDERFIDMVSMISERLYARNQSINQFIHLDELKKAGLKEFEEKFESEFQAKRNEYKDFLKGNK